MDHAATTPLCPEALEAMTPWLGARFGNPSGSHSIARAARTAIDEARESLAGVLGASPGEVVFTSGGTESDNLAICGLLASRAGRSAGRPVVVTSAVEHHAVAHAAAASGAEVRSVPVDHDGIIDMDHLAGVLDGDVDLVSVMAVNNEVGACQPIGAVSEVVAERAKRASLHTDAAQALTWSDLRIACAGADLVSVSAHKFGGPQGVGALVVRGPAVVAPILHGGGQERDRRSGTHNVAGVVGMAAAAVAADACRAELRTRVAALRDRLVDGLLASTEGVWETGSREAKAEGFAHVHFDGVESEALLFLLDEAGICASAGSACASGAMEPSHVVTAMGIPADLAGGSLRMTLGCSSTDADVDLALDAVPGAVARLRRA